MSEKIPDRVWLNDQDAHMASEPRSIGRAYISAAALEDLAKKWRKRSQEGIAEGTPEGAWWGGDIQCCADDLEKLIRGDK